MKKKHFSYSIMFIAVAAFNVIAFASGANETEKQRLYSPKDAGQPCYQTMDFCSAWASSLNYACKLEFTGSRCSHYVCETCTLN